MKKIALITLVAILLAACTNNEEQLKKRAAELCQYIPDHELLEKSKDYLTEDFYNVLDTMFYRLPEHEAMDHEWLYYFVTGNGGTIADYTVVGVEQTDKTHAVATISVRQKWDEESSSGAFDSEAENKSSFDETTDIEEHKLYMEKVGGKWLMSDFDLHKGDCINYIANNRKEQALRDAISDYLVKEIGPQYAQGELCIPVLMMVAAEEENGMRECVNEEMRVCKVWGDFWVMWYGAAGDTLKCVSGGNHSGLMTVAMQDGKPVVTAFEQTVDGAGNVASAKRIFGSHYDIYQNMHSNQDVREAVRREQLQEYVKRNNLPYKYYQDYGWPAVEL